MKRTDYYKQAIRLGVLSISLFVLGACRDSNRNEELMNGKISLSVSGASIIDEEDYGKNQANKAILTNSSENLTLIKKTPLGDGLELVAEFIPIEDSERVSSDIILKASNRAADGDITTGFITGAPYFIGCYVEGGAYVDQRNYVAGSESTVSPFILDGGPTYRFIGATRAVTGNPLLSVTPAAGALSSTVVTTNAGSDNQLYIYNQAYPSNNIPNNLSVKFKNVAISIKSVSVEIDASVTDPANIAIDEMNASFVNLYNTATYNFDLGQITSVANSSTDQNITFTGVGTRKVEYAGGVTGGAKYVAHNTNFFKINLLRAGGRSIADLTPFDDVVLAPGKSYNLKMTIKTFEPLDPGTVDVNGQIWMMYNVGVNPARDHFDYSVRTFENMGYTFLFGRKIPYIFAKDTYNSSESVSYGISGNANNWHNAANYPTPTQFAEHPGVTFENSVIPSSAANLSANSWNSGTEALPQKTVSDPCPYGYRVPTRTEFQTLMAFINNAITGSTFEGDVKKAFIINFGNGTNKYRLPLHPAMFLMFNFEANGNYYVSSQGATGPRYWTSSTEVEVVSGELQAKYFQLAYLLPSQAPPLGLETRVLNSRDLTSRYGGHAYGIRCIKQRDAETKM